MIEMIGKLGGANIDAESKVKKLHAFFKVNEQQLNSFGPNYYLDVQNAINDVIRRIMNHE